MEALKEKKTGIRFTELDALRGIAVLTVVLYHYTYAYDYHYKLLSSNKFYLNYGDLAVQLFFLISGFVIFLTLEKSKNKLDFVVSRFSRLYPAYWAAILLTVSFLWLFPVPTLGHYTAKEIFVNFTMLEGFAKMRYVDQVYWTLKIELTFYIIMYILYVLNLLKHIELICIFWLLLSFISLTMDFQYEKYPKILLMLEEAPLFIAGISFYKIKTKKAAYLNQVLILISFIIGSIWIYKSHLNDLNCIYIIFVLYSLFYLFSYRGLSFLNNKLLLFFGAISYPLYLIHNVIGYSLIYRIRRFTDIQALYVLIPFIVILILAIIIHIMIEKPSLRFLRNKYQQFLISKTVKAEKNRINIVVQG